MGKSQEIPSFNDLSILLIWNFPSEQGMALSLGDKISSSQKQSVQAA